MLTSNAGGETDTLTQLMVHGINSRQVGKNEAA